MRKGVKGRLEFFQKFIRFGSGTLPLDSCLSATKVLAVLRSIVCACILSMSCMVLLYFLYMLSMLCNVHVVQVVVVHVANVVLTQALDVARAKAWHQRRRLIPSRLPLEATLRNCSAQRIDQSKCISYLRHMKAYISNKVWESALGQVAINQTATIEIFLFNPVTFNLKTRV